MRPIYFLAVAAASVGAILAAWALLALETGVTGTAGAIIALVGTLAVVLGGLLLLSERLRGARRGGLVALTAVVALLTALAGWFLMQWALSAAMALAFVTVVLGSLPAARRTAS